MTVEVNFIPVPQKGEVTITIDSVMAGKLCALLGMCNGNVFSSIYYKLIDLDIEHGQFKGLRLINLFEHTFVQD